MWPSCNALTFNLNDECCMFGLKNVA
jgi:hypothetical protein